MRKSTHALRRIKFSFLAAAIFATGCARSGGGEGEADQGPWRRFATLPLPRFELPPIEDPAAVPARIVSLVPSATEVLFSLGLGDRVVGRSHWCDFPPEARAAVDLGRFESFSAERIADLRPGLVVLFRNQHDLASLLRDAFRLVVVQPATESAAEILDGIQELGRAAGVPARGRALVARIEAGMADVRRAAAQRATRPRVLVLLDRDPFYVPGRTSFVHSLLDAVGAENVAAGLDTRAAWPTVGLERILEWNPEVILDLAIGDGGPAARAAARASWERYRTIDAVEHGRIHVFDAGVLVRPGPRMAAVAELLAEVVHGGA